MTAAIATRDAADRTLVLCTVGDRSYALFVETVLEVVRMVSTTTIPDAPPWISGVIDLRGRTLPVIDLRTRLGLDPKAPDLNTMIVVIEEAGRSGGLIVDEAVEAISVPGGAIAPPHELIGESHPLAGTLSHGEKLILVLDVSRLLGSLDELRLPDISHDA